MGDPVDFILAQDPLSVVLLLVLISALENVFPPVPGDVAAALGAFWAVRAGQSPVLIGLLCFAGNQLSAITIYFWARAKGEAVLRSKLFRALLPEEIQPAVRARITRYGSLGVFLSRFLPGLRAGVLPFAAIHGLSPAKALPAAVAASLLWYAFLTMVGAALGLAYEEVRATVLRITGLLGTLGMAAVLLGGLLVWRARRKARGAGPRS